MKKKIAALLFALLLIAVLPAKASFASEPTDAIRNYQVNVTVNDNATLNLTYNFDWEVLESDGIGPVSWVTVGLPNDNYSEIAAISENISYINPIYGSDSALEIHFNKDYYEGEVISFSFSVVQDYMYEMNVLTEGESVFYFTPGWFDGIAVDNIEIMWDSDKAIGWSHGAVNDGGTLRWQGALAPGEVFNEISVTYPSDAFAFDESKFVGGYDYYDDYGESALGDGDYYYDDDDDAGDAILGFFVFVAIFIFIPIKIIKKTSSYASGSGFGNASTTTKKKITRTLIKYYPTCPGCGATRAENQEKCEYCGRSFIESEEVVEEKDIEEPSKYETEGTYHYGGTPNTYVRVHVATVHVPVSRPSCAHSSCAHSSCACAHSCACACACACAGGGRAGCSVKDFYNTNLKLSQLARKLKK